MAALLPVSGFGEHSTAKATPDPIVASELEVVTVTDESVVLTWTTRAPGAAGQPVRTDGEVRIGPADSRRPPTQVWAAPEPTPFHYAEIDGLEPGRTYRFEAWSSGIRATPAATVTTRLPGAPEAAGTFTTLVPPPGRMLRTLALANDVHYGETVSGLLIGELPPGFRQAPNLPPYPEVMLDALLDDLRAPDRAAETLLLAGDLTSEATDIEMSSVRARLDTWTTAGGNYLAVRGNHDRPHTGGQYRGCGTTTNAPEYHDCWADHFGTNGDRQQLLEHELGELRLLGLDTSALDGSGGVLERPQLDRLSHLLHSEPDRPTIVFGHHPVTAESGVTNLGGAGFRVERHRQCRTAELLRGGSRCFSAAQRPHPPQSTYPFR